MPFTLSHAAAAIPFRRTRLIPSALVAGCLVPDFEYCLPVGPHGAFGHTIPGAFAFDLPVALVFLWLFHRYAKKPLWSWLPLNTRRKIRLGPDTLTLLPLSQGLLVVISILVGVATHILWDSFTHSGFWPYQHFAFLRHIVTVPILGPRPFYRLLQHASTILGLVVIWVWWHFRSRSIPAHPIRDSDLPSAQSRMALFIFMLVALIAGTCAATLTSGPRLSDAVVARSIVTAMSAFWFAVIIYGAVRSRQKTPAHST